MFLYLGTFKIEQKYGELIPNSTLVPFAKKLPLEYRHAQSGI